MEEPMIVFELENLTAKYLDYCQYQKALNGKTLKAYSIDLKQFINFASGRQDILVKEVISDYITFLHKTYKPKSIKRKIACLRAFCNYLEYEEIIDNNPFAKLKVKFQEPIILPKTIPFAIICAILAKAYQEKNAIMLSNNKKLNILRDIAVLELLFATGIRVSELCSLSVDDINLSEGSVRIFGKGSKERMVHIGNEEVIHILSLYKATFYSDIEQSGFFFINRLHKRFSEQSVRGMISKYTAQANIDLHITPHMFRHSFATLLLEEDVDIRYIQQLLGHSSIITTQIYTHVASRKQRDILSTKHPRNKIKLEN